MNSALYQGWVSHRRHLPRGHAFRYRIGLLYLVSDSESVTALERVSAMQAGLGVEVHILDRATLETVTTWIDDPAFATVAPHLRVIQGRLATP